MVYFKKEEIVSSGGGRVQGVGQGQGDDSGGA